MRVLSVHEEMRMTKLNDKQAQELQNQLHIYLQQLQELQDILKRERDSMGKREFSELDRIIQHKMHLLNEAATFDDQLSKTLKRIFRNPNKELITKAIDSYKGPLAKTLQLQFTNLRKAADECKRMNDINGRIVNHAQQHYGRIISMIKREDPNTKTYCKKGREYATSSASGGKLAQA